MRPSPALLFALSLLAACGDKDEPAATDTGDAVQDDTEDTDTEDTGEDDPEDEPEGEPEGEPTEYATVEATTSGTTFLGQLEGPAGWYQLELRVWKDGQPIDTVTVAPVGIGEVFIPELATGSCPEGDG